MVAGLPEQKIRVISPDIGGGFGNKVGIYPGYVLSVVGSIVTGKPVKWVEDRSENLMSTSFARDYHMHGEIAATRDGRILGAAGRRAGRPRRVQQHRPADEVPGRLLPRLHRQLRLPGGALHGEGRLHQQGARRGGLRLLVPGHRGRLPRRAHRRLPGRRAGHGPGRTAHEEPAAPRAVPVHVADGVGVRLGDYPRALQKALEMAGYDELRREQAEKRERGELMGIGVSFFTEGSAPVRASTWTSSGSAWPTVPRCGSTRPARRSCASRSRPGSGPRDDVRPDRRRR